MTNAAASTPTASAARTRQATDGGAAGGESSELGGAAAEVMAVPGQGLEPAAAIRHIAPVPRPFSLRLSRAQLLAVLGALIAVSLTAELASYARPDIGFLLDAAGRVLDGAKLYVDVVEINPPLIVAR